MAYLGAAVLFILSLGGLSNPETSRRGQPVRHDRHGLAVLATVLGPRHARRRGLDRQRPCCWVAASACSRPKWSKMTQMPELVALMHSPVGWPPVWWVCQLAWTPPSSSSRRKAIHEVEIYIGILTGAVTFSGSLIAFGKLNGKIGGKPLLLPGRHWHESGRVADRHLVRSRVSERRTVTDGMTPLIIMTVIALLFGIHMVMAIGGADMPVVVSMLNSYSGWAAAATGFMLSNDLLIVTGALVGSSGPSSATSCATP